VESQEEYDVYGDEVFVHTAGQKQKVNPGKPMGLIAIATAIKDMRALTSLNLSSNNLTGFGTDMSGTMLNPPT
jgi:hypothetical protein